MSDGETRLPRALAVIVLLVSVLMFIALVNIALTLAKGGDIDTRSWLFPLIILGAGAILMWLLKSRQLSMQLYLAAFALWLLTTGYYLIHYKELVP